MITEIASQKLDLSPSTAHAHCYHLEDGGFSGSAWSKNPHDLIFANREAYSADPLLSFNLSPSPLIRVVICRISLRYLLDNYLLVF